MAQGFSPEGRSQSPTMMSPAMSIAGTILGTAPYMAPEQARGKAVDKRTDIWAFGCVLFEMLTGAQAFGGETVSDSMANVLGKDPNWNALPASTPASVRRLLTRCLERDPKRRLHDIADARLDIEEAIGEKVSEPPHAERSSSSRMMPAIVGFVAAVALLVVAAGTNLAMRNRSVGDRPTPEVVRFIVGLPAGFALSPNPPSAVLSPDGRYLAIVARDEGGRDSVFLRAASDTVVRMVPIAGTASAGRPFFSPDSRWIAFFTGRALMKVPVDGGVPVTIASIAPAQPSNLFGADWGSDGAIVFAQRGQTGNVVGLFRVSASGGTPATLLFPDAALGETGYGWPQHLPDGDHLLFSVRRESGQAGAVALLSMRTGQKRLVIEDAAYGRIVPTGHLLFVRGGNLLGVSFNQKLEIVGEPFRVQQGIGNESLTGGANFTVAATVGTAAMVSGGTNEGGTLRLVWVDRQGRIAPAAAPEGAVRQPRLSPDGQRLLVDVEGVNRDVWLYDLKRDLSSRLTTSDEEDETPVWSPDGLSVAWAGVRNGKRFLLMRRADGSDSEQRIWSSGEHFHVNAWAPDGRTLLLNTRRGQQEGLTQGKTTCI